MNLEGSAALVTGAASGLGAATVAALAARGVEVLGVDLEAPPDRAGVRYVAADVTSGEQLEAAFDALGRPPLSETPLRLAVACAGIAPARRILSSSGLHDLATFQRTIDVNLVGTFNLLRLAAARMAGNEPDADGQRGLVVTTASVAAFEGQIGQVAYAASKAGVAGMTIAAARDLARTGIRVNTIAPGIVDTPLLAALGEEVNASLAASVPFPARLARPEEFARLVLMLAEHDYLNGETIRMDGALRMPPR